MTDNEEASQQDIEATWVSDGGNVTITVTLGGAKLSLEIPDGTAEAADVLIVSLPHVLQQIADQMANCPQCNGPHQGGQHG